MELFQELKPILTCNTEWLSEPVLLIPISGVQLVTSQTILVVNHSYNGCTMLVTLLMSQTSFPSVMVITKIPLTLNMEPELELNSKKLVLEVFLYYQQVEMVVLQVDNLLAAKFSSQLSQLLFHISLL